MKKFNVNVNGTVYSVEVEEVGGTVAAAPVAPSVTVPVVPAVPSVGVAAVDPAAAAASGVVAAGVVAAGAAAPVSDPITAFTVSTLPVAIAACS